MTDIPKNPKNEYDPIRAKKRLACARTYLDHADQLIYSYGSRTFLSGYDIYDPEHDNRGNIDCSTFVLLVLAGISYEESPYGTGTIEDLKRKTVTKLVDLENLPDQYVSIAERIGRPYLEGPRGLDLDKAEEMGISLETLKEEIKATGTGRWSVRVAQYFQQEEACFLDASAAQPGDLVFFCSKDFFKEGDRIIAANQEITHVGIVAEDTSMMIQSSGTYQKDEQAPAVSLAPIIGKRDVAFFARPEKPAIKAIFFDVDGTLLSTVLNIVPYSAQYAIKKLRERGIQTVIASARHMIDLEAMPVQDIPFDGFITVNGQLICDSHHKAYAGNPIDHGEMQVLEQIFRAKRIPFAIVNEKGDYINYVDDVVKEAMGEFHDDVPEVGSYAGEDVYQIMAFVTPEQKELLDGILDECSITSWSDTGIDIIPRTGGKTVGIQNYLDLNGINRAETMAFGDGENDIEMLKFAGIGVAMGNAKEKTKEAADYVTDTVENHGVLKALRHFELI